MAILLFLLAIAGGVLVGDLVLENTDPGSVTVLDRTFTGYTQGQLLAAVAALGLVIGALVVASLSLRKSRRVRVRELRQAERDLTDEVAELERENRSLGASCPAATRGNDVRPRPACRPTAPPTRSTTSPGGRPASAATWSPDRLRPAWEPRPDSAPASP
jgi:uncharacterized membrane protein YciS (DUF1049 family)